MSFKQQYDKWMKDYDLLYQRRDRESDYFPHRSLLEAAEQASFYRLLCIVLGIFGWVVLLSLELVRAFW